MGTRPNDTLPITVVIPAYNRARLLERALRSVNDQSRPADQVVVVDDASTDDTPQVAEALGAELIRHGRNIGGNAAARDTGLRAARHEWVALLDDDDEWLPHHLETLWSLTPGSVLVASSCVERVPGSTEHGFHGPLSEGPTTLDPPVPLIHPENLIPASAAMVHRDTALSVGGFRGILDDSGGPVESNGNGSSGRGLSILGCEDLDMWCRLLSSGRATLSPRVGVIYHTHPGQISGDWEAMHIAHLNVARSFAGADWWSRGLIERRAGVTAWDRFRGRQRAGEAGAGAAVRTRSREASAEDAGSGRGASPPCRGTPADQPAGPERGALDREARRHGSGGGPGVRPLRGRSERGEQLSGLPAARQAPERSGDCQHAIAGSPDAAREGAADSYPGPRATPQRMTMPATKK